MSCWLDCSPEAHNLRPSDALPVSAQTPVLHEDTGQTYRRWPSCGAVASELPTPATSSRYTGQMYLDLLLVFRCRHLPAAEMLTDLVRSSAYTRTEHSTWKESWTNSTSREQHAVDFDLGRFTRGAYEAAAKAIATQPVKSDAQPTHAAQTTLSTWKISWIDFAPQ